jgi:hypothetical protein
MTALCTHLGASWACSFLSRLPSAVRYAGRRMPASNETVHAEEDHHWARAGLPWHLRKRTSTKTFADSDYFPMEFHLASGDNRCFLATPRLVSSRRVRKWIGSENGQPLLRAPDPELPLRLPAAALGTRRSRAADATNYRGSPPCRVHHAHSQAQEAERDRKPARFCFRRGQGAFNPGATVRSHADHQRVAGPCGPLACLAKLQRVAGDS